MHLLEKIYFTGAVNVFMKKIFKIAKQPSDTFRLGIMLSIVGGFVDAYTFIVRGGVLANAQTGNIVFFGLRLIEKRWKEALFCLIPILSFIIGVLIAEFTRNKFKNSKIHWRQIIIIVEIIILSVCAFVPSGNLDVFVNIAVSFICSLQVQAFRKTNGNLSATTMCTGNLRSGSDSLYYYLTSGHSSKKRKLKKKTLIYFGLIFFFITGAVAGSFFSEWFGEKALLAPCLILFSVFAVMFKDKI